jgi:hypothetical protein
VRSCCALDVHARSASRRGRSICAIHANS